MNTHMDWQVTVGLLSQSTFPTIWIRPRPDLTQLLHEKQARGSQKEIPMKWFLDRPSETN